jgi:hypothetical protein
MRVRRRRLRRLFDTRGPRPNCFDFKQLSCIGTLFSALVARLFELCFKVTQAWPSDSNTAVHGHRVVRQSKSSSSRPSPATKKKLIQKGAKVAAAEAAVATAKAIAVVD